MPRIYYRKLIRDRIPEIIEARGLRCRSRRLPPAEYARALKQKLLEESRELLAARGRAAICNELADIRELLDACRRVYRIRDGAFERLVREKRLARGGFGKRLFLEYTEKPR